VYSGDQLPMLIRDAGTNAERRFQEFFTAHIRNPGTNILPTPIFRVAKLAWSFSA